MWDSAEVIVGGKYMASNEYFRGEKEKINKQLQKLSKKEQIKPQKRTELGIIKGITEIGQMII